MKSWIKKAQYVLTVIVAVSLLSVKLYEMLHRESGYYQIEPPTQYLGELKDARIRLTYYLDGSSNKIKRTQSEIQKAYTDILLSVTRQLDAETVYEGMHNIASLNASNGELLRVSPELYFILKDAYDKQGKHYCLFSGALWSEWQKLLYLEDPTFFDPANNPDTLNRLNRIAKAQDIGTLTFVDDAACTISLRISEDYRAFLTEYDITAPILHLGRLHDAYLIQWVADALTEKSLTKGYLTTVDGLVIALEDAGTQTFNLLAPSGNVPIASVRANAPHSLGCFYAFAPALQNYGRYTLEQDDKTLYRHAFYSESDGLPRNVFLSLSLVSNTLSMPELMDIVIQAVSTDTVEEVGALLSGKPFSAYFTLQNDGETLYALSSAEELTLLDPDYRVERVGMLKIE
jgi:hypothetical protein